MLYTDQINIIINNRENGIEAEDGEIDNVSYRYIDNKYRIDNVSYRYIDDKYKDLIKSTTALKLTIFIN